MGRPKNVTYHNLSWTPLNSTTKKGLTIQSWGCKEYPGIVLTWFCPNNILKKNNPEAWPFNSFKPETLKDLIAAYEKTSEKKTNHKERVRI